VSLAGSSHGRGTSRLTPRPDSYDPGMDEAAWDERYAGDGLVWTGEANRFVTEEVVLLAPGTALDLACGEGRNAVWLAQRGWQVTGVDWSGVGLAKARELAAAAGVAVEWVQSDVVGWTPPSAYDLVLLSYVHLAQPERAALVATAAAAVARGGSLLLVGHDVANLAGGVGGPQDAGLLWTPEEVRADGMEVTRSGTVERETEDGTALDTVVRLVRPAA